MKKIFKTLLFTSIIAFVGLTSCNEAPAKEVDKNLSVTDVSLSASYLELNVGDSFALNATVSYKDNVEVDVFKLWSTSDNSIVTVDQQGFITAVKSGTVNISYCAGYKMAGCEVHVLGDTPGPGPTPPDPGTFTITLNQSRATLSIGETLNLIATTSEPAAVTWASSDSNIASVDSDGHVVANDAGLTTITASANGVNATCAITVEELEYDFTVFFFIDYNNVNEDDTTGTQLIAQFDWFFNRPLSESGLVPANPTTPMDPAFPYFIGWSSHSLIDTKDDLWDMEHDTISNSYFLYLYGIWAEVPAGEYTK